jgi:hypothetical protein
MKSPAKLMGAFELNLQLETIEKQIALNGLSESMILKLRKMNELCLKTVDAMKSELNKLN